MKLTKEQFEELDKIIDELPMEEIVNISNNICYFNNNSDDEIFSIDDFDEVMYGRDPYDIACRVSYGDFNPLEPYFKFDAYGNLESIQYTDGVYIDTNDVIALCESDSEYKEYLPHVITSFVDKIIEETESK